MTDEINPYESPSEPSSDKVVEKRQERTGVRHILLLAGVMAIGLVSFAPWVALLSLAISTPVFFRLANRYPGDAPEKSFARALLRSIGMVGLGVSVLAASMGTFYGTCTAAAWGAAYTNIGYAMQRPFGINDEYGITGIIIVGGIAGVPVGIATMIWLIPRCFRK